MSKALTEEMDYHEAYKYLKKFRQQLRTRAEYELKHGRYTDPKRVKRIQALNAAIAAMNELSGSFHPDDIIAGVDDPAENKYTGPEAT